MKQYARIFLIFLMLLSLGISASAASEYNGALSYIPYVYDYTGDPVAVPAAYVSVKTITAYDLGVGSLSDLSDISYDGAETVYLTDSSNNRIIITDLNYKVKTILETFDHDGKKEGLSAPSCVEVAGDKVYVADAGNARILCFDKTTLKLLRVYSKPVISILDEGYTYTPQKIAVDYAGRIYVIAKGINQGFIQLDENGAFMSFLGAPAVHPDFLDKVWRYFLTKEQIAKTLQFVPTEYISMHIDHKGFIYATTQSSGVPSISRINSQGLDILKYDSATGFAYPNGDGWYRDADGEYVTPNFVDIEARPDGSYLVLDGKTGRLFNYDEYGNLLYIFGSIGSQDGSFYSPSAFAIINNNIVVIDKAKNNINVFAHTTFGKNIDRAVVLHSEGQYDDAEAAWKEVIRECSNYDMAYVGLARIYIQKNKYKEAMTLLEAIGEKDNYYTDAFQEYRSLFIRQNFYWFVLGILVVVLMLIFLPRFLKKRKWVARLTSGKLFWEIKYGSYLMFHPFDGYWDLKREKRGSAAGAGILFALFALTFSIRTQYSGYLFINGYSDQINVLYELALVAIPMGLWCVSNWCFTTLMDGEGTLKEIFVATGYALTPYVVFSIPLFILSHVFCLQEAVFYHYFDTVVVLWVLFLMFTGMMMTHDYTVKKSVLTLILSLLGIAVILFITLLFTNLLQDIITFGLNVYKEITFRLY